MVFSLRVQSLDTLTQVCKKNLITEQFLDGAPCFHTHLLQGLTALAYDNLLLALTLDPDNRANAVQAPVLV